MIFEIWASGFTSEVLTPELLLHAGLYVSGLVRQGLWLRFQAWRAETREALRIRRSSIKYVSCT